MHDMATARGAGSFQHRDAVTAMVEGMVISREPVTQRQFDGVLALVSAKIRTEFELSQRGAEQAVRPVLRRLIPVLVTETKGSVRR